MRHIAVTKRFHDGTVRDRYDTRVADDSDGVIVCISPPTGSSAPAPGNVDGLLELYFTERYYNVWHICESGGGSNLVYANVATPASWNGNELEWVDLQLDVRVERDGTVRRLDEEEFLAAAAAYAYPPELVATARRAWEELTTLAVEGSYPFDHETQVRRYTELVRLL